MPLQGHTEDSVMLLEERVSEHDSRMATFAVNIEENSVSISGANAIKHFTAVSYAFS
jgi:hypothetical protein